MNLAEPKKDGNEFKDPLESNSLPTDNEGVVDKQQILGLIEAEIRDLHNRQTRKGLTIWALLGGLATTLWLLSSEVISQPLNATVVTILVLGLCLFLDLFRMLSGALILGSKRNARYASPSQYVAERHIESLFEGIRLAALAILSGILARNHEGLLTLVIWNAILSLRYLALFSASLYEDPPLFIEAVDRKRWGFSLFGVPAVIFLIYRLPQLSITTRELRVAALITLFLVIGLFLSRVLSEFSVYTPLVNIRRDLTLGRTNLASAISRLESAVYGIAVTEVVTNKFEAASVSINNLAAANAEAYSAINKIEGRLLAQTSLVGTPLDGDTAEVLEAGYVLLQKANEQHRQFIEQFREITGFVYELNSIGRYESARKTLAPLFENFEAAHRRYLENRQRFYHNLREIEKLRPLRRSVLVNSWLREALKSAPMERDLTLSLREYVVENKKGAWLEVILIVFVVLGVLALYYYFGIFDWTRG